jgi:hypothetical protein
MISVWEELFERITEPDVSGKAFQRQPITNVYKQLQTATNGIKRLLNG